jgi:hypothetical protein
MGEDVPPTGAAVLFRDLVNNPELNGMVGICNGDPFEVEGACICPVVAEIDGSLQQKFIRPQNLAPVATESAPSWAARAPLFQPDGDQSGEEPKIKPAVWLVLIIMTVLFIVLVVYSRQRVLDKHAEMRQRATSGPALEELSGHDEL